MEKVVIELEAKTDKALKGIDNVAKSVEDLNKSVTKGNKDTAAGLKDVEKSSNLVGKGIKGIGTAIKAAGIGLIIGLLGTLKELFEQNQKAVDLFNVVFETSANVVGQVVNAFTDIYDAVSKSKDNFDALGKVMSGLMTIVINPLIAQFNYLKLIH
jgi:lipopolysaccharide biosynthesis regulator YciM